MTIPRPAEVTHYVTGVVDMARGDARGLAYLDISTRGFWRSFWALFYALPAFVYRWFLHRELALAEGLEVEAGYIFRLALVDLAVLVVTLAVLAALARPLGMTDRFVQWVIADNWLSLPLYYAWGVLLVLMRAAGAPSGLSGLLETMLYVAIIWICYRVYKVALDGDGMLAVGIIVITTVIGLIVRLSIG